MSLKNRLQRLLEFSPFAVALEKRVAIPAEVTCAQWAAESAWGSKTTAAYNYFGVKFSPKRHKAFNWCRTTEYLTRSALDDLVERGALRVISISEREGGLFHVICEDRFAVFRSIEDAIEDRALMMTRQPYKAAYDAFRLDGDTEKYVRAIARIYATAPDYADLLWRLCRQDNIRDACARARAS